MSGLRPPGLGPIVGHTTDTCCRLWIRAGDPADTGVELDEDRRTIGVIAPLQKTKDGVTQEINHPPAYFRLHREFDRTGTFNLGQEVGIVPAGHTATPFLLEPDTEYVVGFGTLTIDDPHENDDTVSDDVVARHLPPLGDWGWITAEMRKMPPETQACFRTMPKPAPDQRVCFLLGSCRYPGVLWKIKNADRIFNPMNADLRNKSVRCVLMIGDQIYADEFNQIIPVGRGDTAEEFQDRYVKAFSSTNMRRLLRSVPTYMILDDHEIEDNWTQDKLRGKSLLFNLAIGAYMSYQWSHGPRSFGRLLYYTFDVAGYPCFVLDTRTQRYKDTEDTDPDLTDNHMIGRPSLDPVNEPSQLTRLLAWLDEQQKKRGHAPKFIVSSSVFVPNAINERWGTEQDGKPFTNPNVGKRWRRLRDSDSWPAFPSTRRTILKCIVDKQIQNVVFLSGDIHSSNVARLTFKRNGAPLDIKAFAVTSSAFYWPFPFADGDPANYVHDSTARDQEDTFPIDDEAGITMDYQAFNFTQEDNYCRLTIEPPNVLRVQTLDVTGKPLLKDAVLDLERWL